MSETYRHVVTCPNCKVENAEEIEKGVTIETHLRYSDCFNCGCVLLPPL
jgi:hypothetical protein